MCFINVHYVKGLFEDIRTFVVPVLERYFAQVMAALISATSLAGQPKEGFAFINTNDSDNIG